MNEAVWVVLEALPGKYTQSGERQWSTRCPAHDDKSPSLSIGEGDDGRALLHCHANQGCTTESIAAALGLEMSDLFPEKNKNGGRHIATSRYRDETGVELYQKRRYEPKTFTVHKPDGSFGLGETRRVLYRLPEVTEAIKTRATVYLVEGEKDADAMAAIGLVATTVLEGAGGKWREEYTEQLKGAKVVIVADKDEPGRKRAAMLSEALGAPVVEVLEGKDPADWISAGAGPEDFEKLQAAPDDSPTAITLDEFLAEPDPKTPWILEGVMAAESLSLMAAEAGIGKSTLMVQLGLMLAAGPERCPDFFGHRILSQVRVLYLQAEGSRPGFKARVGTALHHCIGPGVTGLPFLVEPARDWNRLVTGDHLERIIAKAEAQLTIIDTQGFFHEADENSNTEVKQKLIIPLQRIARSTGSAFVIVHHLRKPSSDSPGGAYRIRGASAFRADTDASMLLDAPDGDGLPSRILSFAKTRNREKPKDIAMDFRFSEARFVPQDVQAKEATEGETDRKRVAEMARKILEAVKGRTASDPLPLEELKDRVGPHRGQDFSAARAELMKGADLFMVVGAAKSKSYYPAAR